MSDHERGLYLKYHVERLNDPTGKHRDCEYYVLDLVHDRHAAPALLAYATSCEKEFPQLAADLRAKAAAVQQAYCEHYWIPNSGLGGEPEFKPNRQMSSEPLMHVQCQKCGTRTWFTEVQWHAIPVRGVER